MPTGAATPTGRRHIRPLTGIRALAAIWVVMYHLRAALYGWFPPLEALAPLFEYGFLGVDLFFVLSGFILSYNYLDRFRQVERGAYGRFLWLRLARIYPVHLFTLAALAGLLFGASALGFSIRREGAYSGAALLENLVLVHGWGFHELLSWNRPSWSISAEWFAYLLFPFVAFAIVRVRRLPVVLAVLAASLAVRIAFTDFAHTPPGTLLRLSTEFLAGVLLYRVFVATSGRRLPWGLISDTAAVGTVTLFLAGVSGTALIPLFGLQILSLGHGQGLLARALATRPLVYGGEVSYSLYMTHAMVILVLDRFLPPGSFVSSGLLVRLGVLLAYAAVFAVGAIATYHLVEEPARRFMRRAFRRRREVPAPEPASDLVPDA